MFHFDSLFQAKIEFLARLSDPKLQRLISIDFEAPALQFLARGAPLLRFIPNLAYISLAFTFCSQIQI